MVIEKQIEVINKLGLHARAAAKLVNTASAYASEINIEFNDQTVNAKSIMGIMMGCSHFVHGVVPKGSRSPGMKTLEPQPPQVTILSGFFALSVSSDTIREI